MHWFTVSYFLLCCWRCFWCLLGPICCVVFFSAVPFRDHVCLNMPPVTSCAPPHPISPYPCATLPLCVPRNPCVTMCVLFVRAHMVTTVLVFVCVFVCSLPILYVCACLCLGLLVHICWCFVLFSVSVTALCAWVCVCTCISCLRVCVCMCVFLPKYVYIDSMHFLINHALIIFTYLLINISYLGPIRLV